MPTFPYVLQFVNNIVATFWDDLNTNAMSTARAEVLGSAGSRRFVIEWGGYGFYSAGSIGTERLTFQAKLFEGTNVIELHYCTLAANGGTAGDVTGVASTIGVENATGSEAIVHSPAPVNTTNALRFTP